MNSNERTRRAAADAMNETRTNPSPQAQFLATTAANRGYEEGVREAFEIFRFLINDPGVEDFKDFQSYYQGMLRELIEDE